jgi:hypothetical protein
VRSRGQLDGSYCTWSSRLSLPCRFGRPQAAPGGRYHRLAPLTGRRRWRASWPDAGHCRHSPLSFQTPARQPVLSLSGVQRPIYRRIAGMGSTA